ncbi:hypothetical protein NS228_06115 [Methylobacterium indicum]|nr:hypothetical protein NS229_14715 [Methylobacterium indicum]KTS41537.1 hypothetical protein NS228_06115 [Methylobacterium indicum]KTS52409.1 hypothetical protein NS230_09800 [Methylobacterium indicum]
MQRGPCRKQHLVGIGCRDRRHDRRLPVAGRRGPARPGPPARDHDLGGDGRRSDLRPQVDPLPLHRQGQEVGPVAGVGQAMSRRLVARRDLGPDRDHDAGDGLELQNARGRAGVEPARRGGMVALGRHLGAWVREAETMRARRMRASPRGRMKHRRPDGAATGISGVSGCQDRAGWRCGRGKVTAGRPIRTPRHCLYKIRRQADNRKWLHFAF